MTQRAFLLVVSSLFALGHAIRLVYGWKVMLGKWTVPLWVSWVGLLVAGYLAYQGFRLERTRP